MSGAHNFKAGFQDRWGYEKDKRFNLNGDLRQQYRTLVPNAVTAYNTPLTAGPT